MGVVYLVTNRPMQRREVLKVMNKSLAAQSDLRERFLRELRSAARLNHTNVATAYAPLQSGQVVGFTMEYVQGDDLDKVLRKAGGKLPVANACHYVHQAALGLQHAFEKGLVHRDIKPGNMLLAREGKKHIIKIVDFGLAKVRSEQGADENLTGAQTFGTPAYMAPEQWRSTADADIRADIYSLGCTLYFLLTGSPPFNGRNAAELMYAHQSQDPQPPHELRPDVPAGLSAIVGKMLAKDMAQRYQTPIEVAQALAPFLKPAAKSTPSLAPQSKPAASKPPAEPNPAAIATPKRTKTPGRRAVLMGTLAVFLAIACGVILYIHTDKGTIKIELPDPNAKVEVKVDGDLVAIEGLGQPLRLRAGQHSLEVSGAGFETLSTSFTVKRGENPALQVTLTPKEGRATAKYAPAVSTEKKRASAPKPAADLASKLTYDFSQPRQLADFIIQSGDWEIRDGALFGVCGKNENAMLQLKRQLEGPIRASWVQMLLPEPSIMNVNEEKGGISLANRERDGLHYDSSYHAAGGFGPEATSFHEEMQLFAGLVRERIGPVYGPISRVIQRGEPMVFNKAYRLHMSVEYSGHKSFVRLGGAGWEIVNAQVDDIQPTWLRLWSRNCRLKIQDLRIETTSPDVP